MCALAADLAAAEADSDLADALAAPQLGVGARYEFEDDRQHTIVGIFSLTLPFFDHGQGLAAVARAKAARAKTELAAKRSAASVEVETAARVAEKRAEAGIAFDLEKGVELSGQPQPGDGATRETASPNRDRAPELQTGSPHRPPARATHRDRADVRGRCCRGPNHA
jgi:hypothetical protein